MGTHLVYTLALDPTGATGHHNLAKLLVSSLLRTRFSGHILVFHNSPHPLFMVAREGVREVRLPIGGDVSREDFVAFAQSSKHSVDAHIDRAAYDKIMFIDCDSIVLRNIDHLLEGTWDLAVLAEMGTRIQEFCWGAYLTSDEQERFRREGYNSGTVAVAASRFGEFLERWRAVEERPLTQPGFLREQGAFNRLVLDWDGFVAEWPQREIALPLVPENLAGYHDYTQAAIVHAASGAPVDYKLRFLFSLFAGTYLFDSQLTLFNILEM